MHARPAFEIRPVHPVDVPALADIYRSAILELGDTCYTPEQVSTWASFPEDGEAFHNWVLGATTLVAADSSGACMGFGGLEAPARISALFVSPGYMRRGVGSAILERLIAAADSHGVHELVTQASEFSKPLFEQFGFTVDHVEHTSFKKVAFLRYVMRRSAARNKRNNIDINARENDTSVLP